MELEELRIDPEAWPEALARVAGPQIVVGGPGTGKTEFLVRRVAHLVDEGVPSDEILVLSFSRRAVADLDGRLHHRLSGSAPVVATTFHSLAAALIEAHAGETEWVSAPMLLTGPEQAALMRELLANDRPENWSPAFRPMLGTATLAEELTDIALRSTEQMMLPSDIERLAATRQDWTGVAPLIERYRTELVDRGRIDYGLLLLEATTLLERGVPDTSRYRYVLVDEYQDTSLTQSRLLRALTSGSHNLTACADPYQSIYSFRGARVANVATFADEMTHAGGPPPLRIVLTTSFRTPHEILQAAERITSHSIPGAAGHVEPADHDGDIRVHVFDQQTAEAEWIASQAERAHLVDGLPYADMAVFVRSSRRFVSELSRALERRGIRHETPTSRLAENPTVRFVLDVVTAATTAGPERDRAVRSLLVGPWLGLGLGETRTLERRRRIDNQSWTDTIARLDMPGASRLAALIDDDDWAASQPAQTGLWSLWLTAAELSDVVFSPARADERAAWTSLSQVIARWNERNPTGTLVDYQALLMSAEFEATPLLSYRPSDEDQLTITTMHQAKGTEFEIVFIADAVDGVLPDLRARDSLLGVRHLLPDVPTDAAAYRLFRLQEERRLAYTAMTRARRRVVWTATTTGLELGQGAPSRFLPLVAGVDTVAAASTAVETVSHPVTPAEAEALLRRGLGDPERSPSHRLAALDVLRRGAAWRLRPLDGFAGVLPRGRNDGLVEGDAPLSATQADSYDRCPRRYAMERRLGVGDAESNHLVFGRLVHSVIEAATHEAIERGEPHPAPDVVLAQLTLQFDGADFGGPPFDFAWWERAVATVRAYLDKRPELGTVIAGEHPIDIEMGQHRWRGVIDAVLDLGDGRLMIVDYKTGATMVTLAEAANSLQLGLYVLGALQDESLARFGTPVAAEYWYLYRSMGAKALATRSLDIRNVEDIGAKLEKIADAIGAEDWTPRPGSHCDRCPVRRSCPALPAAAEGFVA